MTEVLTILIIISLSIFVYFKIKQWRAKLPIETKWQQTRGNMALGTFLMFFGINLLYFPRGTVEIIVGIIFALLGLANIYFGYQAYKHYLPQVIDEAERERFRD